VEVVMATMGWVTKYLSERFRSYGAKLVTA
jgi:hypothetical protein